MDALVCNVSFLKRLLELALVGSYLVRQAAMDALVCNVSFLRCDFKSMDGQRPF
jgi:hypothetical protein